MKPILLLSLLAILPAFSQETNSEIPPNLKPSMKEVKDSIARGEMSLIDTPRPDNSKFDFKVVSVLSEEAEKQALRDLKATYEKAIAEGDLSLVEPHLADDFTAVMITADEVKDYEGIKSYWKKVTEFIGKDGTYTVSIVPDDTIFEGNIAIAKGTANEHVVRNGKTIDIVSKWTAIARKEEGKWKLVRIQATIDPVTNPIVTALGKAQLWITASIAALSGLLIGWFLGRRKRRA